MPKEVRTWVKFVSGMEYDDTVDAEKLIVRQVNRDKISFEFWDYEGKRGEMTTPTKVATVLSRSIMLCVEGSLGHIEINL